MKYTQRFDGEWFRPKKTGHLLSCCDCKLVHLIQFKLTRQGAVLMRAYRDERRTAARRRTMPLLPGKKNIGKNIRTEVAASKPVAQAKAIALRVAGVPKAKKKR